jgi:UDP-N-acetylmuramoyl-L-alanyl-D-glutamate--2,6-diaminopimelate ligase
MAVKKKTTAKSKSKKTTKKKAAVKRKPVVKKKVAVKKKTAVNKKAAVKKKPVKKKAGVKKKAAAKKKSAIKKKTTARKKKSIKKATVKKAVSKKDSSVNEAEAEDKKEAMSSHTQKLESSIVSSPERNVVAGEISWSFAELIQDLVYAGRDIPVIKIHGLKLDSRQVRPGDLFMACEGRRVHARTFINDAISNGASVVMWESSILKRELREGIPVFGVPNLKYRVGDIAERFYGNPSKQQFVIGVTGTNGKTSVSQFIAQAMHQDNKCGVVGTLGNGIFGRLESGLHTTPDAVTLHSMLAELKRKGANKVVMEVSSHALDQGRVAGVEFDIAVFTNLTHEHLDYHGDMQNYGIAKRRLFETKSLKYAVINIDDEFGRSLLVSLPSSVGTVSYGFDTKDLLPSLLGSDLKLDQTGLRMRVESDWGNGELRVPILGSFNGYNLLAALGALLASGIGFDDAMQRLSLTQPVDGRMEGYGGKDGCPLVVVDYAHTPDALQAALNAIHEHAVGKIHCVFGCGGNRDRAKRPMMAKIAEGLADHVVVTDDNPRTEDSELIIADILSGFTHDNTVHVISDRAKAIAQTIAEAADNDVVLVAGKGHEKYQLIGDQQLPFSDAKEVEKALAVRRGRH